MKRRLIIVGAVFVAAAALLAWSAPSLATHLIVERPLEHADAMMVLSGSTVYNERGFRAAELYKRGVASRIFLTDDGVRAGWSEAEKTNPRYVDITHYHLVSAGVPESSITILPDIPNGTESEARMMADVVERDHLQSVLIVTSAYHSRRALWTFDRAFAGKNVTVGLAYAPLGDLNPQPSNWWRTRLGWRLVAGEYVKAVAYWLVY